MVLIEIKTAINEQNLQYKLQTERTELESTVDGLENTIEVSIVDNQQPIETLSWIAGQWTTCRQICKKKYLKVKNNSQSNYRNDIMRSGICVGR